MQAAYFVLIARAMGPSTYGAFVAIVALTGILSPFAGLGSCNLFVKNVKSGKRPKSKSPSESPAARPTPSANDLTPSRRTTTAADGEDVPSTTRHSTPMTWAMIG